MSGFQVSSGLIRREPVGNTGGKVRLDYRRFGVVGGKHVTALPEYNMASRTVKSLHDVLMAGTDSLLKDGTVTMTGWKIDSPYRAEAELDQIIQVAAELRSKIDDFISIGIGGSFLGNKATIEAILGSLELFNLLGPEQRGGIPRIFFLGNHMDPGYTARVLEIIAGRRVGVNVISKSGGTVESAIAFAILKECMENGFTDHASRIVAVTDKAKGALKKLSDEIGYAAFEVPDNVGGRYSVTSPVGLFGLAVAGIDIKRFIAGARFAEEETRKRPIVSNIAMLRAVMRYVAYTKMGIKIEVAATGTYDLKGVAAWMQQLGPESEGKDGKGIWISPEFYTQDAHANGQMIQMGERNIMETFLMLEESGTDVVIPGRGTPVEYLDGRTLSFANRAFVEGLRDAHYAGGVPTMSYIFPALNAFTLGQLYQYEMNAIALSALLLEQNPFIQPGVQQYKRVADAKSGKPGTESYALELGRDEQKLNPNLIA